MAAPMMVDTGAAAAHRRAITSALGPDVRMRFLQQQKQQQQHGNNSNALALYAGLFGAWSANGRGVNAAKVIVATVRLPLAGAPPPPALTLGDCPWIVLQLQSVDEQLQPELWARLSAALAPEFAAAAAALNADAIGAGGADGAGGTCPKRLVFDPLQRVHAVRPFADTAVLAAYRIRRVERHDPRRDGVCCARDDAVDAARPVSTVQRDRIEYRAHLRPPSEGAPWEPTPVVVWVERARPRRMLLGAKVAEDYGYVRDGTLLAAAGEFRTWIAIEGL